MLTYLEVALLAFEARRPRPSGAKEQAAYDAFGLSAPRYYQALNAVIDRPGALEYDPMLVHRLRRLRETRSALRAG